MPNVFGIEDDILIEWYHADRRDHSRTMRQVIQICHQEKLKLNRNKKYFSCTKIPFLGDVISREGLQSDLTLLKCDWNWNITYQNLHDKTKNIIKKNVSIVKNYSYA